MLSVPISIHTLRCNFKCNYSHSIIHVVYAIPQTPWKTIYMNYRYAKCTYFHPYFKVQFAYEIIRIPLLMWHSSDAILNNLYEFQECLYPPIAEMHPLNTEQFSTLFTLKIIDMPIQAIISTDVLKHTVIYVGSLVW